MPVIVTRRTVCRLCGSSDLRLALHLTPTPLADGYITAAELDEPQLSYDLDLFLCETCGFLQLLEIVSPEGIYVDYIYETTSSLGLARHFQRYANQILDHIMPEPDALIVDLGSNDGTLLRAFKERGMRVLGIDPAREIARQATEAGIETLPLFFNGSTAPQVLADYGHAAIITCNNLFANIDQLDDVTD